MTTMTESELKIQGVNALVQFLGEVNAERFISLIKREPFDYTKWQRNLWENKSGEEISKMAMEFRRQEEP